MESGSVEFAWEIYMYDCFILSKKLFTAMRELPNLSSVCLKTFEKWKCDGIHFQRIYASFKRSAPVAQPFLNIYQSLCAFASVSLNWSQWFIPIDLRRRMSTKEEEGKRQSCTFGKNKSGDNFDCGIIAFNRKVHCNNFWVSKHEWMSDPSQLRRTKANCFQLNLISLPLCVCMLHMIFD